MENFLKFIEKQEIDTNTIVKKYIDTETNKLIYILEVNGLAVGISSIDNR